MGRRFVSRKRFRSTRGRRVNRTVFIPRKLCAKATIVKLPYREVLVVILNTASAWTQQVTFNMNNIHEPIPGITAHQPMGHDQWFTLYHRAVVLGSQIRCKMSTTSISGGNPRTYMQCGLMQAVQTTNFLGLGANSRAENPQISSTAMTGISDVRNRYLKRNYRSSTFWRSRPLQDDDVWHDSPTNNPSKLCVFSMIFQAEDLTDVTIVVEFQIDYLVYFAQPTPMFGS